MVLKPTFRILRVKNNFFGNGSVPRLSPGKWEIFRIFEARTQMVLIFPSFPFSDPTFNLNINYCETSVSCLV